MSEEKKIDDERLSGECRYCGFKLWYQGARQELINVLRISLASDFFLDGDDVVIGKIDERIYMAARRLEEENLRASKGETK